MEKGNIGKQIGNKSTSGAGQPHTRTQHYSPMLQSLILVPVFGLLLSALAISEFSNPVSKDLRAQQQGKKWHSGLNLSIKLSTAE